MSVPPQALEKSRRGMVRSNSNRGVGSDLCWTIDNNTVLVMMADIIVAVVRRSNMLVYHSEEKSCINVVTRRVKILKIK
jgi:hypothetical protein